MTNKPDALPVVAPVMWAAFTTDGDFSDITEDVNFAERWDWLEGIEVRPLVYLKDAIGAIAQRDTLIDQLSANADRNHGTMQALTRERDTLQAELAAMREQKPVAYCSPDSLLRLKAKQFNGMMVYTDWRDTPCTVPLYAAPVSAPSQVAADPMAMIDLRVEALKASPWGEHADRTGAFVKGALWHAMRNGGQVGAEVVQVPRTDAESLIKAADVLIAKADGFSVSGVYFNEFDHNSVALITLGLELDTLRALLATSQGEA